MKELSIEEKARRYDEAIKVANNILEGKCKNLFVYNHYNQGMIEYIFSELAESEDEKVRKSIIAILNNYVDNSNTFKPKMIAWLEKQSMPQVRTGLEWVNTIDDACDKQYSKEYANGEYCHEQSFKWGFQEGVDWLEKQDEKIDTANKEYWRGYREGKQEILDKYAELEKQGVQKPYGQRQECADCQFNYAGECKGSCSMERGEQKPADKVEPKFKVGDWITNGDYTWQIVNVTDLDYILQSQNGHIVYDTISHVDEQFRSFTLEDAKDGDVLVNWNNTIYLFKGIEEEVVKFYCYYNTNCEEFNTPLDNNSHLGLIEPQFEHHPATKEQRDTLMKAMADAGYTFDFEKKELRKIEQEPAEWSEEDERIYKSIIYSFAHNYPLTVQQQEFVKSLKYKVQSKQEWGEEDENNILFLTSIIEECFKDKEEITLYGDTACADFTKKEVIDRLKSLKDRVQPQKQEWSDVDKDILFRIINDLKFLRDDISKDTKYAVNIIDVEREINWLKSLRPQNNWKPSDRQMKALKEACDARWEPDGLDPLYTLWEQLKKLKE